VCDQCTHMHIRIGIIVTFSAEKRPRPSVHVRYTLRGTRINGGGDPSMNERMFYELFIEERCLRNKASMVLSCYLVCVSHLSEHKVVPTRQSMTARLI